MEETVLQMKELRVIEHEEQILDFISQSPLMRIQAQTHANVVKSMIREYNERYFPQEPNPQTEPKEGVNDDR